MEPVKLGVIGCGVIGPRAHLEPGKKSDAIELVAVADLIQDRADKAAAEYEVPRIYYSGAELLEDENVEAVSLAMPVGDRTPLAYQALERGKHVLLEKPVAANVDEVRRMMELRGDRTVGVCSPRRSLKKMARIARQCVESGALGDLRVIRARALLALPEQPSPEPPPWRESMAQNGGGILVNWSCYELDMLMSILGWRIRPRRVLAQWWPVNPKFSAYVGPESDADAHFSAMIVCDEGIVFDMERAEFAAVPTDQAWQIIGTDASLSVPLVELKDQPTQVVLTRAAPGKGIESEILWDDADDDGSEDINVLDDFAHAIREGREPATNLERALLMQQITDAIYESGRTRNAVEIG